MEVSDILRQAPQEVSQSWEAVQLAQLEEDRCLSRAFLRAKAKLVSEGMAPSPAAEEAKHIAKTDDEYEKAYVERVTAEAQYRRQSDAQINARKLAELQKQGI